MASSSLDFIQTVPRVATLIYQTHQLWQEFQDIPDSIAGLVDHLKALEPMFCEIETQFSQNNASPAFKNSLELSKRAHNSLETLVKDLKTQLNDKKALKRKYAAVKVLLRKSVLERLEQSLSRCLTLLQIAIQSYQMAVLIRLNPENIVRTVMSDYRMQVQQPMGPQLLPQPQPLPQQKSKQHQVEYKAKETIPTNKRFVGRPKEEEESYTPSSYGRFALDYTRATGAWQAKIQLPSWLSERVYEVMSAPAIAGWTYSYRVYNIISGDAEIISRIETGDTTGVLELFSAKKASPFDKTPDGDSLLHLATRAKQYELCKLFLKMGLQCFSDDRGGFGHPYLGNGTEPEETGRLSSFRGAIEYKIAKLFLSSIHDDDVIPTDTQFGFIRYYAPGDKAVNVFRQFFMPTYFDRPLRDRLEAIRLAAFIQVHSGTVEKLFSRDGNTVIDSDVSQSTRERISLIHSMAIMFGCRFPESLMKVEKPPAWLHCWPTDGTWRIIPRVLNAATLENLSTVELVVPTSNYTVASWRGTPLSSVIGATLCYILPQFSFHRWDYVFHRCLLRWLVYLQDAGFDLLEYGKRERSILHDPQDDLKGAFDVDAIERSQKIPRYLIDTTDLQISTLCRSRVRRSKKIGDWMPLRIIDIKIGPQPADWKILWAPEIEYMASEFWRLVEGEEDSKRLTMPGAWIDDR
ncbi:hypothetical protein PT974_06289 [Cladobotryum mycophilum]|uniref:NACHT-NTPase and P-loop NTPases N-terminal domain-containing protein n=1 Tax=Cladobotryum mycophilum TaxID=491253 RepID=A0ABR0SLV6_9HYPO